MSLQSTLLTTTPGAVYTSSGNTAAMTIYFTNYSSSNVAAFSLWAVKNGDLPENKNILYVNVTVQPGDTYLASTERLLLDNNDGWDTYLLLFCPNNVYDCSFYF